MKKMYKNIVFILFLGISISACKNQEKETVKANEPENPTTENTTDTTEAPILLGKQKRNALEVSPYNTWFEKNYNYSPKTDILEELKPELDNITFTVFMGTWCEDSQKQVPAFFRILDMVDYNTETVTIISVSEDKDTPENLEKGLDIAFVPTILLYEDGKEIGRIVEYPIQTLEEDLLTIASGNEYKHAYEE